MVARALAAGPECAKHGVDLRRAVPQPGAAMTDLPRAFALSLGQLSDPAILRVLGKSLLATVAIFALLGTLAWRGLSATLHTYASGFERLGGLIAIVLTVIAGWLLFRMVALAVIQFFADDIVRAVEARHYPAAAAVPDLRFADAFSASTRGLIRAVVVNAIVLPFALVLLVTGLGTASLFWAANGWLLGRELTEMVWLRHRSASDERLPLGSATRFALGGIVAALLIVPFVNLLAPVIGAAAATHLVHRVRKPHA